MQISVAGEQEIQTAVFSPAELPKVSGFSSEFAKFLENNNSSNHASGSGTERENDFVTKKCSVRLPNLDISLKQRMEARTTTGSAETAVTTAPSHVKDMAVGAGKRDNEGPDGSQLKRPKSSEDVIVLDGDNSPPKSLAASQDISIVKINNKVPARENISQERKGESKLSDGRPKSVVGISGPSNGSSSQSNPTTEKKMDPSLSKTSKSLPSNSSSTLDKTDRTSLQCLEQKLLDLKRQKNHSQEKTKTFSTSGSSSVSSHDSHTKLKSISPSGIKSSKDSHHRRTEAYVLDRKKTMSSPVKKVKKPYSAPTTPKENKLGGLFCPTTDAKVTILPCKTGAKEGGELKTATGNNGGSNSVTITKVSSGDSCSVPAKDIKKVFSPKSDGKIKLASSASSSSMSSGVKTGKLTAKGLFKSEKLKNSDKSEKLHKEHRHKLKEYRNRESSKDGRERRERVGSLKIIRCSKCREVFSTKEAKKLHTCNSKLDAHYLIDGGDRQKTSPISSASNSDRSESTSASLSRSSSRSSSPGMPISSAPGGKKGDSPKPKAAKRLDDDKIAKVKISLAKVKSEEDREKKDKINVVKKDVMREKWVETKPGSLKLDRDVGLDHPQGLIIEAMQSMDESIESKEMRAKEDAFNGDPSLFAFSGKRTYSPSMSEATHVDGKGRLIAKFYVDDQSFLVERFPPWSR